jgi:hypothetical protein
MVWLSGDNPTEMQNLERMPIIDYWFLLNRKYAANQKMAAELQKLKSGRNTR